jgi:hypothetical protein
MVLLGVYLFQKGQDFGLFKLAMWAQPVIALCLAQGFAGLLFSERPASGPPARPDRPRVFFLCTISQVYYAYSSLGTYGGGLTEVVKGSALGVGFTPPKNLKYGDRERHLERRQREDARHVHAQGIDTRFLSRSYMDNIANIAVLKFLRTPDPDLGPRPGSSRSSPSCASCCRPRS